MVLVATLFVGSVLTYWQATAKIETEVDSALAIAEKTVRQAIQEIAGREDPRLELLRLVRVFDGNRHVRASFVEPSSPDARVSSFVAPVEVLPSWFFTLFETPSRVVKVELPADLRRYGRIELESDQRAEIAEVWDDAVVKLIILSVFCALVLSLVYLTIGHALEPLSLLSGAFGRIGRGDYAARVAEKGPTELRDLAHGFNEMAERLGEMERRNQQLNEQLTTVQDEERADLARDLHDEVSPFLFSVDVDAATIRRLAEGENGGPIAARVESIREAVAHMKKHVRSILSRLRPAAHLELGLANAIESLVASWQLRNPDVTFNLDINERSCGTKLDGAIHAIVREAMSNALKHGKPTEISVSVDRTDDDGIRVLVRDNGSGLSPASLGSGFGLIAMRERVAALGGTVRIANRSDGSGVEVVASLPAGSASREPGADLGADADEERVSP